ncbi:target of Nesh-SH3-like isoform X3 [Myxocyprinus asiaticus]|uniref:target of Nesh-SH3-like isoform X3 n=1 Tax=Myxocyprinus asiaticus TaxID=70543 RepID=UPI002222C17D|nr:target of Nesh-SH3-like isoform X3 [Myxocyprinus asiaticus]
MQAFLLLFLSEMLLLRLTFTTTLRGRRQNMKVRISAIGDTIIFKFLQPHVDNRLEGYILGYGSSMFSKQFIQLPEDGQPYETELDAEPKYLLALQSVKVDEPKKQCTGKVNLEKPLHLVIGSVSPSSVLLSWGTLLTTPFMDSILDDCIDEGQFTVRYRKKEPSDTWNYQTCPTSSTVIDNLKPDTLYEFEVRADTNTTSGVWSPPVVHNTADQIIHEPFKELNQAKPEKPVIASRPSFLPPVPVLNNITQTRAAPLLRQTGLQEPQKTSGRDIFHNSSSFSHPLARNVTQSLRPHARVPPNLPTKAVKPPLVYRNSTLNRKRVPSGEHHIGLLGPKTPKGPRKHLVKTKLNQASETKEKEKVIDLKQVDPVPLLKPLAPPTSEQTASRESTPTTPPQSAFDGSHFETGDNSSMFSHHPASELDAMGKKRFVAPHVIYKTDKRPEEPCSVTHSLSFFPDEEVGYLNVTGPPKTPPTNLTVVTVEGCPSFVILDWEKSDNETTEYEVVSSTKGPHGEEVFILTTNQTHTAVENLKPESSYEFKVTPKNELGSGPASDLVSFSTESADPRVSEIPTGKTAIWSSFPFKADSYSECNGRQFIKRTWYRKFVGIQLCNSLRYKIYLSDSLTGKFYNIGDQTGYGEDHCQFVDSYLDGRTGGSLPPEQLPPKQGYFRAMRQEPVTFGEIGGNSLINYVAWYECGIPIPGKW